MMNVRINHSASTRAALIAAALLLISIFSLTGCVELQALLSGTPLDGSRPGDGSRGNGDGGDDGAGNDLPVVSLSVSNPVPALSETVVLTCGIVSGDATDARFSFDPDFERLIVDDRTGTATFIVLENDIGVSFSFRCSATTPRGVSAPSNQQIVVPVGNSAP
jgi:hypothetical protein